VIEIFSRPMKCYKRDKKASNKSSRMIMITLCIISLISSTSSYHPTIISTSSSRIKNFHNRNQCKSRSLSPIQQKTCYNNINVEVNTKLYGLFDNKKEVSEVVVSNNIKTDEPLSSSSSSSPPAIPTATTSSLSKSSEESNEEYTKAIERSLLTFIASSLFCFGIYFVYGNVPSEEYFAGYLVEQSLSVDNLLVFLLLFDYFKVPTQYQNKILKWGIVGAVVMRAIMISAGAAVISKFHGILLFFAGILVYSSGSVIVGMMSEDDDEDGEDLSKNWIVNFSRSLFPTTDRYDGDRFFTVESGKSVVTPMFLCMVAVELSDVVFAVDSIPAVFGITENPLIVFSSNMFAIIGLRSLYTILAKAASDLKYLEPSVAVVLGFIGFKMIAEFFGTEIPTTLSLGVVITMLSTGVILSLQENQRLEDEEVNRVVGIKNNE